MTVVGLWIIGVIWFLFRNDAFTTEKSDVKLLRKVKPRQTGVTKLVLFPNRDCQGNPLLEIIDEGLKTPYDLCKYDVKSAQLISDHNIRIVDVYRSCGSVDQHHYESSIYPLDGCVNIYHYPKLGSIKFSDSDLYETQISTKTLKDQATELDRSYSKPTKARIIFSCESSEYFGYQVWANYFGFLSSSQKSATWTRLLTATRTDDLTNHLPGLATFQAKRHMYSKRYSPINKADVIQKWYASSDAPQEEVILVIDPDNWLLKDVSPWTDRVKKGKALGEAAYYHGSKTAQKLWKELCEKNCERNIDLVGVPYVVHREDLREIAPLWKHYSLKIKESLEKDRPGKDEFDKKYKGLDVNWAAEMFGYNMASAHAGVVHEVIHRMQVRDVASTRSFEKLKDVAMIHMGRAWFPKDSPIAKRYAHTEGKSFSRYGQQVWCKCNYTASTIIPWPVPAGSDFQSTKTLEILHGAMERFGKVPDNYEYRRNRDLKHEYGWKMP